MPLLLTLVLIFSLVGCSSEDEITESPVKLIRVNGGDHTVNLTVGQDYSLPAKGTAVREDGREEEISLDWDGEVDTSTPSKSTFKAATTDVETSAVIEFSVTVHPESGTEIDIENPQVPTAPQNIKTEKASGEDGVSLTWDDTAAGYIVYRGDKYSPLFEKVITTNQYTDYTATPGEEYTYYLQAVGESGLNSDLSAPVTGEAGGYNGVKIHYKYQAGETPWLYAWVPGGEADINGEWPGKAMTEESNNWYVTELAGYSQIGLKFTKEDTTSISGDLMRSKGEWWYKEGTWYYTNPEK